MKQKFQTFAPLFPGFYGSHFEYDNEEQDIESYNEEHKTNLNWDDFNWDYAEYNNRVAKAFVNRLERELKQFIDLTIEFEELYSPKEYNFSNDSINVAIELDLWELLKLIEAKKGDAEIYFKDRYTSCSGFISFHSNQIDKWLDPEYILEDTKHRVGALLGCLCHLEIEQDDIIYWTDSEMYIDFSPKEVEAE